MGISQIHDRFFPCSALADHNGHIQLVDVHGIPLHIQTAKLVTDSPFPAALQSDPFRPNLSKLLLLSHACLFTDKVTIVSLEAQHCGLELAAIGQPVFLKSVQRRRSLVVSERYWHQYQVRKQYGLATFLHGRICQKYLVLG